MDEFERDVMRSLGRIEQKVDGQAERVDKLEKRDDEHEQREWLKVAVMVPVTTILHALLNKFGVKV